MTGMRLKIYMLAAATLLAVSAAHAADLTPPPPPQPCCNNWYLRGYAGIGLNGNYTLDYLQNPANSSDFAFDYQSIADTPFIGGAIGYNWNNWLRFEASAEYRAKTRVYAFGHYTTYGWGLDTYDGELSSSVYLANAFVDLGTWDCFTPFIGAGVGGAYVTLSDFSDVNPSNAGFGLGRNPSDWNLAYAFYAGVSYEVAKSLYVDLTYRYLNYGSITDTVDCNGGCNPDSFKFDNLYSNDIMFGLHWTCCDVVYQPPPLETRG